MIIKGTKSMPNRNIKENICLVNKPNPNQQVKEEISNHFVFFIHYVSCHYLALVTLLHFRTCALVEYFQLKVFM